MPLTGTDAVLSASLRSTILSFGAGALDNARLTELCDALAQAILAHIVANATVLPTTAGVPTLLSAAPGAPVTGVGELQ